MANKICPDCGTEQDETFTYCKNCGAFIAGENSDSALEISENPNDASDDSQNVKICPECGEKQEESAKFCKNCGASLSGESENNGTARCINCGAELHDEAFCPDCGKATGIKICPNCRQKTVNEDYCSVCGYKINPNVKTCANCGSKMDALAKVCAKCGAEVRHKNVFVAFILSFIFPGLGQLYNNQNHKGLLLIIGYIVSWILCLILIGAVLLLLIWIYGMYDAVVSAKAINNGEFVEDKLF